MERLPKATVVLLVAIVLALVCSCGATPLPTSPPTPTHTPTPLPTLGATISGFVFRDFDANGTRDIREPGEPNITVSAYDADNNLVDTTTTDVKGEYVLNAELDETKIVTGEQYLVVFSEWPEGFTPGPHGPDSGTEQQFVVGGATDVGFGVFNPDQYIPPTLTVESLLTKEPGEAGATPVPTATVQPTTTNIYEGTIPAPSFPEGLDWINTGRPITLADLSGKVVLLEFWTYGCINCIQDIPKVKLLEEKYGDELVVIGVHSAKFPHERQTDNIRNIVERYELQHPVINDDEWAVAGLYGASVWPTYAVVNPIGRYLGSRAGDMNYAGLDQIIGEIIQEFDARGQMDRTPLDLTLELDTAIASPLRFPGAVLADEANNRLFISDSNHNRIVITDLDGNVQDVIGTGERAWRDGDFETASFFHPQGLALADGSTLYVADTENHTIRRVDLADRTVETVAGVGEQFYVDADSGPAREARLSSPWDVLYLDGVIYVAMAGKHQLWTYDPESEWMEVFAGSGVEELDDGPHLGAGLNQPTALTTDGSQHLYVADSEASAVRQVDLDLSGVVRTLVGQGFWEFGDVDGVGDEVRMQRPAGIAYRNGLLYVADTYNNKIKTLDPETREARTFLGTGESGWRDGNDPLFNEPIGLSVTGDKLYIADANNHVIRVADLAAKEVSTLVLSDPEGLLTRRQPDTQAEDATITLEPQTVAPGEGLIRLDVTLPAGYQVNELAPARFTWQSEGDAIVVSGESAENVVVEPTFPQVFNATFAEGVTTLTGEAVIYYCHKETKDLCLIEHVRFVVPVTIAAGAEENTIEIGHTVTLP